MRIQHNIIAMNAYRNYNTNASALSQNLEKLSSGYKINRAGDDAAGLAISEKMRAQITGLEGAQKNAQDGISLVQTAEGALTEVHDMLNRMYSLAEQSANGTYDNEVDRDNLQKEVAALKEEINRIADSSNFNGINLLDGSVGGPEVTAVDGSATTSDTASVAAVYEFDFGTLTSLSAGQTLTIAGQTLTAASGGDIDTDSASTLDAQLDDIVTALSGKLSNHTVTKDGTKIVITAKTAGVDAEASTIGGDANWNSNTVSADVTPGADAVPGGTTTNNAATVTIDFTDKTGLDLIGGTMEIGNNKYQFVKAGETAADGYTAIELNETDDAAAILDKITAQTTATLGDYTVAEDGTKLTLTETAPAGTTEAIDVKFDNMGLGLQIGDTSADYNRLTVKIKDMHTDAMGIDDLDIGTQAGAKVALDSIKNAINYVSGVRGDLGAVQNRLDHTINNLGVMQENIQNAESSIRDTDVAAEMMEYTKNNILVQSAQAMLAQANQLPQGVLQLLQ